MKLHSHSPRKRKCTGLERINKNTKMIVGFEINIFSSYTSVHPYTIHKEYKHTTITKQTLLT